MGASVSAVRGGGLSEALDRIGSSYAHAILQLRLVGAACQQQEGFSHSDSAKIRVQSSMLQCTVTQYLLGCQRTPTVFGIQPTHPPGCS